EPGQRTRLERFEILDGLVAVEGAVAVDRKAHAALQHADHRFYAPDVGGCSCATDLDLEARMPLPHRTTHIVAQTFEVVRRSVVSTAGIDRDFRTDARLPMASSKKTPQRLACCLCRKVPQGRIEQTDCAASLTVPARLLVLHHHHPS